MYEKKILIQLLLLDLAEKKPLQMSKDKEAKIRKQSQDNPNRVWFFSNS